VDEEELVRLVARGDRAAFDELYRRTSPWLAVRLRRRCGDDELVAEVMQDTYLAIWRAAAAFAGASVGGSAVGWVWTIAARRLVDALRRRAREARDAQVPPATMPAQVVPAAEDEALRATVGDEVGEALRRLAARPGAPSAGRPVRPGAAPAERDPARLPGAARAAASRAADPGRRAAPSRAGLRQPRPAGPPDRPAMRLLLLYLRSRQVPAALATAVGSVAVLWWLSQATDDPTLHATLGLLAVAAGTAAAGTGLAGADIDLDRSAAIAWPPRRAAHVVAVGGAIIGIVAATALTGDQLAPARQIVRDAVGMSGLVALGAATLAASRAWVAPLTWTLLVLLWVPAAGATYQQVLSWMLQPAASAPAAITASVLGVTGVLAYAILGPRP
jgi:RNA polymerase sigma-70 factor, ECF subfamily